MPDWSPVAATDWCGDFSLVSKIASPWQTYTPQISASTGLITALGTVVATFLIEQAACTVIWQFTITTNGTGAGFIRLTMPVASPVSGPRIGAGSGVRSGDLKALSVIFDLANNAADIALYDGSYPGGDGAMLNGSITYRIS